MTMALLLVSCSGRSPFEKGKTHDVPVKVIEAGVTENQGVRSYVGTASASRTAFLSCRYPGKLVKLNVAEGDYVEAGDIVAEIESRNVISTCEMARSTLRQAEDGYERALKVHRSGSLPDVKMVEIETELARARAAAAAADAALEECRIKAPFSGVAGKIMVTEGMELNPVDNILLLMDVSSIEINFPVPENEVGEIEKGGAASFSVPALNVENAAAEITSKGIYASPLSHTYECTLVPEGKVAGLMPGMVVKVSVGTGFGAGIVIPASTVRTDVDGRYVWTVTEDNVVGKSYVRTGGFSGKGIVVTEGLSAGDRIITEGVQKVCTGMKVRIVE